MTNHTRQLVTLPNISVESPINLGDFELVSSLDLNRFPTKYHRHVTNFGRMYHTINNPIDSVGMLVRTSGASKIAVLSVQEQQTVVKVLDALIFASCYRGRQMMPRRDNFDFTVWEFQGNKAPSSHVNLRNRRFGMNVVENRPHLLQIPQHVNRENVNAQTPDTDVLHALLRCSYSEKSEDTQMMRAINWFNLAHTDTRDLTEYTRFAMTAAAFEALLNTPDQSATKYFRNAVQMLLGQSKELDKWANEFYDARSKIVHGGDPGDLMFGKDDHNHLLYLADFIFVQCAYAMINIRGYWPPDSDPTWLSRDVHLLLVSNKSRFNTISRFNLNMRSAAAEVAVGCLLSIQKYDQSVTKEDCKGTVLAIVRIALDGLNRIARMAEFRKNAARDLIRKYRDGYNTIRANVEGSRHLGVYHAFRPISERVNRGRDDETMWIDAALRARRFGAAKLVNLDTLQSALYGIEKLRENID